MDKDKNNHYSSYDENKETNNSLSVNDDHIGKETDTHLMIKTQQDHLTKKTTDHEDDSRNQFLFKEMYHQAIIESFEILGKQVSGVVISYLEEKHAIQLEDTVDNPQILDQVLENAINGGRRIVERKIIKTLNKKLKVKNNIIESGQFDFAENILKLKDEYLKKQNK